VTIQTGLVEDDHVIEALSPKRPNQALDVGPLPGRARRRQNFFDPHRFHILAKLTAEDADAVSQQVPRDLFKRKCLA
jgi:hypothetical protein